MTDTLIDIDFKTGEQRGIDLMPGRFKDSPNLKAIMDAYADEFQELYDAIKDVYINSVLSLATGRTLEQYGERVDLERVPGQTDDNYRAAIQVQIQKIAAHGSIPQLIDLYNVMIGSTQALLDEVYPCSIILNAVVPELTEIDQSIVEKMNSTRSAGVRLDLGLTQETTAFQFSTENDDSVPEGTGFSSLADDSDGGQLDMHIG